MKRGLLLAGIALFLSLALLSGLTIQFHRQLKTLSVYAGQTNPGHTASANIGKLKHGLQRYERISFQYFNTIFYLSLFLLLGSFLFGILEFRRRFLYRIELEKNNQALKLHASELEQIAFATAHHLQEPIRKIRVFNNLLIQRHSQDLNDQAQQMLRRTEEAALRMQSLVEDIVHYANLSLHDEQPEEVNLNRLLKKVWQDFAGELRKKKATLDLPELPVIYGYPHQLEALFRSLVDNALKFSRPEVPLHIRLSCAVVNGENIGDDLAVEGQQYYKIAVGDNGIGFDNLYRKKIFRLFQRLHATPSHYPGRGLGLSVVHKVMTNHQGLVTASGSPTGALFELYFPLPSRKEITGTASRGTSSA
ncbi:sensor histidine kinase [Compostibacter hankyongensis]|uniref:histidine kinase n=1 Tax=Compostibacter hankyongensis TaxID=1007089 RepID=A0ABP8FP08_9BACT